MAKSVAWREGLFIKPQHFQQNNYLYTKDLMERTLLSGSNMWGLLGLEIDDQLLSQGKISLLFASGVLPDGTLFNSRDFISTLTIDAKKEDGGKPIYLALPLNYINEKNTYFEEQEPRPTRYVGQTKRDTPNTNIGEDSTADIIFAHPNFKLVKEEDLQDGYTSIQIAVIGSVTANKTVSLDTTFQPTYLHLHKSPALTTRLTELQGMLRYRAEKLAEKTAGGSLQVTELGDYLILQLLNRAESRLHYFATQENIHPGELYLELVSIIGELAVFMKKEKRLAEQFTYIHAKQHDSFTMVFAELRELLGRVLDSKSIPIPLDKHKYGVSIALLQDKSMLNSASLVLAVSSNIDGSKLKKLLLDNLKIGTVEEIKNLVNHHLPGFTIEPLSSAPREIPYRVNQSYYKIQLNAKEKDRLLKSSGMALHYPETAKLSLEFVLWAIKNQ